MKSGTTALVEPSLVYSMIRHSNVADRRVRGEKGLKLYVYLRYDMKPSPTGPDPSSQAEAWVRLGEGGRLWHSALRYFAVQLELGGKCGN